MNTPRSKSLPRITLNTHYDQNGLLQATPSGYQTDWKLYWDCRSCFVPDGKYQTLTAPSTNTD